MTLFEVSEKYNIPPEIIKEYAMRRRCCENKNSAGTYDFDDKDLENLSIIVTLRDIGFTAEETQRYMRAKIYGEDNKCVCCMLSEKRNALLNDIHSKESQLQRLDYLKYKLELKK